MNDVNANFSSGLPPLNEIPVVPCTNDLQCDAFETATLKYTCIASACNPDPIIIEQTLSDVDFAALSSGVLSALSSVELKRVRYDFSQNTMTVDVGPVEIYWGPEGAMSKDSMGVYLLGTFPGIPANTSPDGEMTLNKAGNDALTDYLGGSTVKVRFFARSSIDLEPGDDIPQNVMVEADFILTIKASGDLL